MNSHGEWPQPPEKQRLATVGPLESEEARALEVHPEIDLETELFPQTVVDRLHRHRNPLSGLFLSMIAHTILLVALALFVFSNRDVGVIDISAAFSEVINPVEQPDESTATIEIEAPEEAESPLEMENTELANEVELLANENEATSIQMPGESNSPALVNDPNARIPATSFPVGGGLQGRTAESRAGLAARMGGSEASESAVENGLRWIVNHQQPDGSWRLMHDAGTCDGRCGNPGSRESTTAATGLSLLALLGAGYTHQTGQYQDEVRTGLLYLAGKTKDSPHGGSLAEGSMYDHAIATLALSEAMIMSSDESLKPVVEDAMQYIVSAQHGAGGWRYIPGEPGDMTVTGWQLMALKSCQMAGLEPPAKTLNKAEEFLESLSESNGTYYGYQDSQTKPTPTAVGLLSRMYLGWPRDADQLETGPEYLAGFAPSDHDVYFNYYATQVLFHVRHDRWPDWNLRIRDYLIRTQAIRGHENGSWFFEDPHGSVGGRLYTTAMCIMTLEVYYRYLPLYDSDSLN